MLFTFKKYPKDFLVEEILGFDLKGEGDVFFVKFEKKEKNTMDIIHHLCNRLSLERKQLGISGLKDKNAITIQRICIYKSVLDILGGKKIFLDTLREVCKVLDSNRHDTPLAIGKHKYNHFSIVLRFKNPPTQELKEKIALHISTITQVGFPNCFGQQRFGKGNRNFKRAKDILSSTKRAMQDKFEIRFKLQAFSSMFFNHYVLARWKKGLHIIAGDIVTDSFHARKTQVGVYKDKKVHLFDYQQCKQHYPEKDFFDPNYFLSTQNYDKNIRTPTGLILGYNMLLCPNGSKAFFKDWELIKKSEILTFMDMIQKHKLWGIRRPLWIIPKNFSYKRKQGDGIFGKFQDYLVLDFILPTGAYATVLLGTLFKDIDYSTCKENKLLLPDEVGHLS